MTGAEEDRSTAVLAHVGAVFLPVVGPLVLWAYQRKNEFVREHAVAALLTSALWVSGAVAAISLDAGRLSIDEQAISNRGLVGLLALFAVILALVVVNAGRARAGRPPVVRW